MPTWIVVFACELDGNRHRLAVSSIALWRYPNAFEVAAGLQVLRQLGDLPTLIGIALDKRCPTFQEMCLKKWTDQT